MPIESIDAFITRGSVASDEGRSYLEAKDDTFALSVHSVRLSNPHAQIAQDGDESKTYFSDNAIVVPYESDLLMPMWPVQSQSGAYKDSVYARIQPGDLIRVGQPAGKGSTAWMTVVERIFIKRLWNGCKCELQINSDADANTEPTHIHNKCTTDIPPANLITGARYCEYYEPAWDGVAHIALRVNGVLDCTSPPACTPRDEHMTTQQPILVQKPAVAPYCECELVEHNWPADRVAWFSSAFGKWRRYYPLYVRNRWDSNDQLRCSLDVGEVSSITLVGYQFTTMPQPGTFCGQDLNDDEYVILNIRGVSGAVVSNNPHAHGSFAVLPVSSSLGANGASEFCMYEPAGVKTLNLSGNSRNLSELRLSVTDRAGRPLHMGRFHAWFRLTRVR